MKQSQTHVHRTPSLRHAEDGQAHHRLEHSNTLPSANRRSPRTEASELIRSKPLIAAIARELWKLHGGNDVLNWLEAEILLENALRDDDDPPRHPPQ